ncbi:MAG: hypothetical protein KGL39_30265 [Patescibacteria group bacterium]|nr:hypothetical protein [Patescibacteria group bacterium]
MSELVQKSKSTIWEWRLAIIWFCLFSLYSLITSMLASLTGAKWDTLDGQAKFLIILAILANWLGTIMAFVSNAAKRIKQTGDPFPAGDTQFFPKTLSTPPVQAGISSVSADAAKAGGTGNQP